MGLIDRIRYYDGEFLRAFDFSDEQTYHMEMRRRLNRYLHLYGIVEGLNLAGDSEAGVTQVSIMPGLAIDALGREIYVFVPYTLGDSDITTNRITQGGTYDVWLRYQKTASTPPSSGYSNCNQANQYTRWVESFSVVLLQSPSHPFTYPGFSVDDTDDPSQDKVGVLLGTVVISLTSATGTFSGQLFDPNRCKLLGVIAQRIQTPPCYDATQTFNFLNSYTPPGGGSPTAIQNTPLSPAASLEIEPNIFADQNLIVGPDFVLTSSPGTTVTIKPAPTNNDTTPGNVKIAGDLYVQGNIYSLITSTTPPPPSATLPPNVGTNLWLAISAYVNALVQQGLPEIVVVTQNVQPKNDTTATYSSSYATDTTNIPVKTTRLKSVSTSVVIASFSQIQTTDHATFHSLFGTAAVQLSITTPPTATFTGQNGQIGVTWQAGPASGGPPPTQCAIDNFTVTCVVICFP